jgi:glycerol-3-phosphate responsive antiterminator
LKVFRRCNIFQFKVLKKNKTFGDDILWTPLQLACAIGNQNMIDFLVNQGADPSIKDYPGRTAQQISDFLKRGCTVPIKSQAKESKDFSKFIQNPTNYSFQLNGNLENIQEFEAIYKSFCNGKENEQLDEYLVKQIESGKFNNLFTISFFRMNSKEEFFSTILNAKKANSWNEKIRKLFRSHFNQLEDEGKLNEDEIVSCVLEKLFKDWVSEKSKVMKELDSMFDFKKKTNDEMKIFMLKKVKESMKPEMLFPEMEDLFATLKEFKLMKYNSEFELFFQMKSEVTELKSEVTELKCQNKALKSQIEELKSIIQQKGEIMNPLIPHDAVFIVEE